MDSIENLLESARSAVDRAVGENKNYAQDQIAYHLGYVSAMLDQIETSYKAECAAIDLNLKLSMSEVLKHIEGGGK